MTLKDRIKALCKAKKTSMNKVEIELGFGIGYISKLNESKPNSGKLQQIADHLNVSLDYLMGNVDYVVCPECGHSYNPLDDFDCACHKNIHNKILEAQSRFSFLIPYKETSKMIASNLAEIRNDSDKFWDSIGNYLKAEFSNYIYLNYDSEDNYDYDEFCKSTILSMIQNGDIPVSKVDALMECYKIDKERVDDDSAMFARIIKNPQMMRMLKYLEKLEPNTFNVIYKQVKALYEQDDQE